MRMSTPKAGDLTNKYKTPCLMPHHTYIPPKSLIHNV